VTAVNFSRVSSRVVLAACAASAVMTFTACGSSIPGTSSTSLPSQLPERSATAAADGASSPIAEAPAVPMPCPAGAPQDGGTPQWTLNGVTGSIAVTGPTDSAAPKVDVKGPFSVTETQVNTLTPGDGPVVADTATVSVCYMGVNGRDGTVFDSTYQQGTPADFPLDGVVTGFKKAIAGQKVGSTVAVAMTPADGYPEGQPSAGIQKGDTLVFAIKILSAT
jgi:peptidylprolyl isomerase